MRKFIISLILCIISNNCLLGNISTSENDQDLIAQSSNEQNKDDILKIIAVSKFDAMGIDTIKIAAITNKIINELIQIKKYNVLQRSNIEKILKEQKFQYSDCTDISCAVEFGMLVGADMIVIGSMSKIGDIYNIDAKLINVESGQIFESSSFSSSTIEELLLNGTTIIANELCGFKSIIQLQSDDKNIIEGQQDKIKPSFKSPGKALLYSGVLPGMGQVYMGNWMRALLFVSIDAAAIGTWYHNNNLAEDKKKEYSYYANDHWDFGRWVHDYYKWYPEDPPNDFLGDDKLWDSIREVFVNKSDSIIDCHVPPYCYTDIWDHAHSVKFTYDGKTMSSSSDDFKAVFEELCGNSYSSLECSTELENMNMIDEVEDTILVITSHHFYEGIQKYDMFFAGWEDNDDAVVVTKSNGNINVTSQYQKVYRSLWNDYNRIKTLAGNGGKFMIINRVVSMVDAILLAKKWNNKHSVKLSLNTYPDLKNHFGVGGIKLTIYYK